VTCQLCGGTPTRFWTVEGVPTASCLVFDDAESARRQARGDVSLEVCPTCGFIQNGGFDRAAVDYLAPYEESQAASPTFRRFAEETIAGLIERHALRGRTVLEVGCGKGEWLAMLCRAGDMRGTGIDPAYVPGRVADEDADRFEVITDFFGPDSELTGDLVACRHTLEHVPNVADFTRWLVAAAGRTEGSALFIEVPDAERILSEGAFWDVYYEHCAYFTPTSMANLAAVAGIDVAILERAYGEQYLLLEGVPGAQSAPLRDPSATVEAALSFGERVRDSVTDWSRRVAAAERLVLWAATSKTVAFITAVGADPVAVVDINPAKQGTFLPGSGSPVVDPAALTGIEPDLVVAMNPIYVGEIRGAMDELGVDGELIALGPAPPPRRQR
jgi:SAM-dependent methyltransferase